MRLDVVAALFMTIASAFVLYGLSYDTRLVEERVHAREELAARLRSDIAVLKAERAHLARPERIETLARAQGMRPATDRQLAQDTAPAGIITGSNPSQ